MNNPYYPPGPMNYFMQPQRQTAVNPQSNMPTIFDWTLGSEAAKAYYVPPGVTAFLLDREANRFYIKQVDAAGIPSFFQSYDFVATKPAQNPPAPVATQDAASQPSAVSREEFDNLSHIVADMSEQIKGMQSAKKTTQKKQEAE